MKKVYGTVTVVFPVSVWNEAVGVRETVPIGAIGEVIDSTNAAIIVEFPNGLTKRFNNEEIEAYLTINAKGS